MKSLKILIPLFLIAFFFRIWQLPILPPGLWYDEAYNTLDALWTVKTNHYPIFFVGNNGREPMLHYLVLLSSLLFGNTTFSVRLVGSIAGFITVPIMYRFAYAFLSPFALRARHRCWLAVMATAWLAVSWWHVINSRGGFRPVLLLPFLMLSLYFWLLAVKQISGDAQQKNRIPLLNFILAGLFLGLTQYTYLPARLAPLIFITFVIVFTLQIVWLSRGKLSVNLKYLWLGLVIMLAVSAIIFMPLGLYYLNNPENFVSRTGDVSFSPETFSDVTSHLQESVTLFLGAGHELYRHHLPGRAMLGWLEIPFFFIGLVALFRPSSLKRPETQLILLSFVAMWLPALLATPPVHSLRPIGLLPMFYLMVTLGLYYTARWVANMFSTSKAKRIAFYGLPMAVISLTAVINVYDYFDRWANHPETYIEYNGPLTDLTQHVINLTHTSDVIIPLHMYVHPTTRYLLWDEFGEIKAPPPETGRPMEMVLVPDNFQLLYVGNIPASPAMVLLARDENGQGSAYVSRPPHADEQDIIVDGLIALQDQLEPFEDKLGREVALFAKLPVTSKDDELSDSLIPLFDPTPQRTVNGLNWANLASLEGYDVSPQLARPGQEMDLTLYWRSLTGQTFERRLFLQLIDGAGNPVYQWEGNAYNEDMYRWRDDGLLPTQHPLRLPDDASPGPYLVRMGFFDDISGERLPLQADGTLTDIDQVQLGLFYVSADGEDMRQPAAPLSANFADFIQLTGMTMPDYASLSAPYTALPITLHWQTHQPTDKPYTVFLQLLNEQGEVVGGWDQQPFSGLYPTNLWSPGEIIADTMPLPLPEEGLPPGTYRLITGFYDLDTWQRLPVAAGGDFTQLAEFVVE